MHQTTLSDLESALEHFDRHGLILVAAHLGQVIDMLRAHITHGCDCDPAAASSPG